MILTHLLLFQFFGADGGPHPVGDLTNLTPLALAGGILYGDFTGRGPGGATFAGGRRRQFMLPPWAIPIGPTHVRVI